jgi:WD40 repeat protein
LLTGWTPRSSSGFDPLIDRTNIVAFEEWWERIKVLIAQADTVVFVLSPDSVASNVALDEVAFAASLNKRLAPIVFRHVDSRAIPDALRQLNFIFFDDPALFEARADTLAETLSTDIAWIRQHTAFGEAARHWADASRPGGLLLRSPDLERAERWIASRPSGTPAPTQETQTFIAESRRGATRRRNVLVGSLITGLIVALILSGLAFRQRNIALDQRRIAEDQRQQVITREMNRRAALAQELASAGRPAVATAVVLDALRSGQESSNPTPELRAAIHRTLNLRKVPVERYIGDNVFNLALSPDGRTLAAGTAKGMVHVLDVATLAPRFELNTGTDVVSGLDFSPDGKRLVASGDKVPNVWSVDTGEKLFDLQRPKALHPAFHAQFSPDGKQIAVATGENRVLLHDGHTGQLLRVLPGASYEEMRDRWKAQSKDHFGVADPIVDAVNRAQYQIWGAATDAIFSPDGRLVAITGPANPDGSVRLFDAASGKLVRTLTGGRGVGMTPPFNYGSTFAFSPDGSSLIAAPVALTIKVWGVKDGRLRAEFPIRGITSFLLTADGAALVSAHDNGSMIFRCLSQNSAVVSLQAHDGSIDSLSADRAGQLLATGATDQTARIWRMPKSSDICGFDQPYKHFDSLSVLRPTAILAGHGARITKAVFSPDNRTIITASQDGWVRAWSLGADAATIAIDLPELKQSFGEWESALVSSDGRAIFAYDGDHFQWYGWESETGRPLNIPDSVRAIAPGTHHGPILFESPLSHFDLDNLSDRASGTGLRSLDWHGPVAVDGSRAVASEAEFEAKTEDKAVPVLVDSVTKETKARLIVGDRSAKDLFFSPDGSRLFGRLEKSSNANADDSGDGMAVWDAQSGRLIAEVASIPKYGQSTPKSLSHDGSRIVLRIDGNDLLLFDVIDNEFKSVDIPDTGTHFGSGRSSTASTLSADGRYLLVGRSDGAIVVADIKRSAIWRVFDAYRVAVNTVVMSKDGRYVAAADDSNTLWVFDTDSGELIRSVTFPVDILAVLFVPETDRLAVLDRRNLSILPALPSFQGSSDTAAIVDSARKLGFNLVSEEDRQRYKLGNAAAFEQSPARKWAAIDPNSEGTAPVVWSDTAAEARELSIAACQRLSTTCASTPAVTDDMESTFVFFCCTSPRLGCAIASGSGDRPLRTVKETLAKANYSSCEVRGALSARDGSTR